MSNSDDDDLNLLELQCQQENEQAEDQSQQFAQDETDTVARGAAIEEAALNGEDVYDNGTEIASYGDDVTDDYQVDDDGDNDDDSNGYDDGY